MSTLATRVDRHAARADDPFTTALTGGLRSLYQPIVALATGETVAYEALVRGPAGTALESPAMLFAEARRRRRTDELDRACRAAAIQGAARAGLSAPAALFVNVEPEVLGATPEQVARSVIAGAAGTEVRVFFEVTERALTESPAALLEAVERLRGDGFGIALDDVGVDPRSLSLLALLRPDVVKLDMSLIHGHPSRASGQVMNGVYAYAESTGAAIVAEGIENQRHVLAAQSMGATLAQGWHFGRPAPLLNPARPATGAASLGLPARVVPASPVELVHSRRTFSLGRKDVLLSMSRALEAQALELGEHAVVVATFQDLRHFTPATRHRYARLGERAAFVAALGAGVPDPPAPGVRGSSLTNDDVLVGEWDIAVLGPHFAGALVARDLGDHGPDHDRRFEFVLTFDRDLVIDVAATLIARVSGSAARPGA